MEPFSYLGIDWGEKKIGIALADSETKVACAFATLQNDENFFENLARIIFEHTVREVVIGIPSHVNRECVEYAGERLGKIIIERFHIPVYYENEMFTTKMAHAELIARGVRRHLDDFDDREAARIILESFLAGKGRM